MQLESAIEKERGPMALERKTLKEIRLRNMYSQQELADLLDVQQSTVWRWEKDVVSVAFVNRRAICRLFEMDPTSIKGPQDS